jgi:hypothetical protein
MNRLKLLYTVLFIIIFGYLYQSVVLEFYEGFKYGFAIANYEDKNNLYVDDFLMMDVKVKDNNYMDSSAVNIKTDKPMQIRYNNISLLVNSGSAKPMWWILLQVVFGAMVLSVVIFGIWILNLALKIIFSLQKTAVFDRINLKRINRIGIFILIIAAVESSLQLINIYSAKAMIELQNYTFSFADVFQYNSFILGTVILIMSEILRMAIEIKEEQDLTI